MKYLSILCSGCKKPIGTANHLIYVDHEYGNAYYFHNQYVRDCWGKLQQKVEEEFCWVMDRAMKTTHQRRTR